MAHRSVRLMQPQQVFLRTQAGWIAYPACTLHAIQHIVPGTHLPLPICLPLRSSYITSQQESILMLLSHLAQIFSSGAKTVNKLSNCNAHQR